MIKPLVAVCVGTDLSENEYLNETIVNNYQEAIQYFLSYEDEERICIEFLLFDDLVDLNEVLSDIELYYADYIDYLDLEEAQEYFQEEKTLYLDGTEICKGDKFSTAAKNFNWGYVFDHNETYYGTVTQIVSGHRIEFVFDDSQKRCEIEHYKITKVTDEN